MEFKKSDMNFNKIGQEDQKLFEGSWQRSQPALHLIFLKKYRLKEHCGSQHNLNALWYTKILEINI